MPVYLLTAWLSEHHISKLHSSHHGTYICDVAKTLFYMNCLYWPLNNLHSHLVLRVKPLLEIAFIYLGNKDVQCISKTCCIICVFFSKSAIYFMFLSFCNQIILLFFIYHLLQFKYWPSLEKVNQRKGTLNERCRIHNIHVLCCIQYLHYIDGYRVCHRYNHIVLCAIRRVIQLPAIAMRCGWTQTLCLIETLFSQPKILFFHSCYIFSCRKLEVLQKFCFPSFKNISGYIVTVTVIIHLSVCFLKLYWFIFRIHLRRKFQNVDLNHKTSQKGERQVKVINIVVINHTRG